MLLAEINKKINKDFALIKATAQGDLETVKLLLNQGDLDINFSPGRSALDEAIALGHYEIVRLLLQAGAKPRQGSLHIACAQGYLNITKKLLNQQNFDYNAALMHSISQGQIAIIQYLVNELKVEVNFIEPESGLTPLILAIQHKQIAIAQFLIDVGAKVEEAKAHFAMTDLSFAAFIGDADRVAEILGSRYELEICDNEGCTPLMRAVQNGNPRLVQKLIDAGADLNVRQKNGNTALIDAIRLGYKPIVDILLSQDRIEVVESDSYYSARAIALANKDFAIVQTIDQFKRRRKMKCKLEVLPAKHNALRFDLLEFVRKYFAQKKFQSVFTLFLTKIS